VSATVFNCTALTKNAHLRALSRLLLLLLLLVVVVVVVVVVIVAVAVEIVVISFMQGIYNYIPETNYDARAAILWLPFMIHLMLFSMLNVVYFTLEFIEVCVPYPKWLLSAFTLFRAFPVCWGVIFVNDFVLVPVAILLAISLSFLHCTRAIFLL
jgi:hypothetical protein